MILHKECEHKQHPATNLIVIGVCVAVVVLALLIALAFLIYKFCYGKNGKNGKNKTQPGTLQEQTQLQNVNT